MPRRATKTSYGREQGNTPKGKDPKRPGPGAMPQTMRDRFKLLAERAKTMKSVEAVLDDPDHKHFPRVLEIALDRSEGKPQQSVDLTTKGKEIVQGVVVLPAVVEPEASKGE